ncbi:MAG: ABC transporter ATP-binding protein [Patescibacteria group bacterium]|nr:ABC transporter ATP-binding protein [Patescibacteria group bacterium]
MGLIEVRSLSKIYGDGVETRALDGVSLKIEEGEFVAIMGPSGSGKSTLLHILGFLDKPTGGEYLYKGRPAGAYSDDEMSRLRNREMGFVFQSFNLLPRTSVYENVKLPLYYSDIPEKKWDEMAKRAVDAVGLTPRAHHQTSELSGGEQQRAAIARALVVDPTIIFADEPTGNLDSKSGQVVIDLLQNLQKKSGRTIILVTHETITAEHAKRIIMLKDGKVESDQRVARQKDLDDYQK